MAAISWRALAGDVVTRRFWSASKSSRPLVLTTSSPFILSQSLGAAILLVVSVVDMSTTVWLIW
jgi:hypothetical protein